MCMLLNLIFRADMTIYFFNPEISFIKYSHHTEKLIEKEKNED